MRFSLSVLFGIWLWSGIFFLPQGEAQIPLREQIKEELRKELREELKKELREELQEEEKIQALRQEIHEHLITPCYDAFLKRNPSLRYAPNTNDVMKEMAKKFEDLVLKNVKNEEKDLRMTMYFLGRKTCIKQFNSQ